MIYYTIALLRGFVETWRAASLLELCKKSAITNCLI